MGVRRICCIGADDIGGITSSVIAYNCREILVTVVDHSREKIMQWNSEKIPVNEPGFDDVIRECRNKNLFFSTDITTSIKDAEIIFICPGKKTCTNNESTMELFHLEKAARLIAETGGSEKIIVEKSTTPVRATEIIKKTLQANSQKKHEVLSNPEFMSAGNALQDLLYPDRILIGGENTPRGKIAIEKLCSVYQQWVPKEKILTTKNMTSEMAKLLTNAFVAQRISNVNSIGAICEASGLDITDLIKVLSADSRIGTKYLQPSLAFGGRGFKRSLLSLIYISEYLGLNEVAEYWRQVLNMNSYRVRCFITKIVQSLFNTLSDKTIAILGFAFKKNTSGTAESPAVVVSKALLEEGAKLQIFDPKVEKRQILLDLDDVDEERVTVFNDEYQCTLNTHAIVVCTEWDVFKTLDYERIFCDMIKPAFIFDGRNILPHKELAEIGFVVHAIGIEFQSE